MRGNDYKLLKIEVITVLENFRSVNVNIWNMLPNAVVDVDSLC